MNGPSFWIFILIAAVLLGEIVAGRHRNVYDRDDYIVNGISFLLGLTIRPVLGLAVGLFIGVLLPQWKGSLTWVPFWPALIVIILCAEFSNYWVHRFSHEFKGKRYRDWLWRLHRTHHTGRYVNVILNYRISLFWVLVAGLTWTMSLAFYLGQGVAAGVAVTIFSFWGIITHSDFRWDIPLRRNRVTRTLLRGLEHIVISPAVHHSHHGYGKDGGNFRNFGIFLAIFDWMFGTLHIPEGRPFRYGVPGKKPHWAEELFYPLFRSRPPLQALPANSAATLGSSDSD